MDDAVASPEGENAQPDRAIPMWARTYYNYEVDTDAAYSIAATADGGFAVEAVQLPRVELEFSGRHMLYCGV